MTVRLDELVDGLRRQGAGPVAAPARSAATRGPWLHAEYRASSFAAAWDAIGYAIFVASALSLRFFWLALRIARFALRALRPRQ